MSTDSRIPDDVAALISAHALGALDPEQAADAERHIAASDDCRRIYEEALETAAALALAVAESEPPADLRDRIVAAARAERRPAPAREPASRPQRRSWLAGWLTPSHAAALAGVAAAIVLAVVAVRQHDSASSARDRTDALVAILSSPGARVVPLAPHSGGAAGRVVVAGRRAALISTLAAAPAGRTYQAWGIPSGGGAPVPLPTFTKPGSVLLLDGVDRYAQVAVTLEPSGGSRAPTGAPLTAARL
jgi:anti-sigma-K factor RskA